MNHELQYTVNATAHEINYRRENCHDITSVDDKDILCTGCGEKLIAKKECCYVNQIVGTLQCQVCYDRCKKKKPWETSNRLNFCIMCGKSNETLQKCCKKDCTYSSCQACIQRFVSETTSGINKRKWNCFICNIKQLYSCRAVAAAVMASLSEESCDRPKKKNLTKDNENNVSIGCRKRERRRIYKKSIIHSSDSDVSSDMSEENVFQRKPTTQRPSTSVTTSSGFLTKTRNSRIKSLDKYREALNASHNEELRKHNTQPVNPRCPRNKRNTINYSTQQSNSDKSNDKRNNTKQLNRSKNINNNTYGIGKNFGTLTRQISNSSSEKEFSQYKIIPSYVTLQRISDVDKDYTTSPLNQLPLDDTISKRDEFLLKNQVHKILQDLENSAKAFLNRIEHIKKNYHYKEKLKADDVTRMMVECTSMTRDLKDNVNNSEEKVFDNYDTWCKKVKIKNILTRKKSPVAKAVTPHRDNTFLEKSVVNDSNSDTNSTLENFPIGNKKTAKKDDSVCRVSPITVDNEESESSTDIISEFDEKEIFSEHESNNPPPPVTANLIPDDETINCTIEPSEVEKIPEKSIEYHIEHHKTSTSHEKPPPPSNEYSSTDKESEDKHVEENTKDASTHTLSADESTKKSTENSSAMPIVEKINNGRTNSVKSLTRPTTPLNSNPDPKCHNSPNSSVDMFEDEDEKNGGNTTDDTSIECRMESSTPKTPLQKITPMVESEANEEENAIQSILVDSSSCDTDIERIPRPSNKKCAMISSDETLTENESSDVVNSILKLPGNSQSQPKKKSPAIVTLNESSEVEKESSEDKVMKRTLPKSKKKCIDSSDESSVNENIPVENVSMNEEQVRKALLDSSSDSEHEISLETSNEQNHSLSGDDELSDAEDVMKNNSKRLTKRMSTSVRIKDSDILSSTLKSKREKFILRNNIHYKSDPKLRMVLTVRLTRLDKNILEQHSNALKKSKEYLENKEVKSLVCIDNIEKKKKKAHPSDLSSSSSSEDCETSMKRPTKSKKKEKESEETLLDHLNKATEENGASDIDDEDDEEDRDSDSTNKSFPKKNSKCEPEIIGNLTTAADKLYKAALLESSHSEAENNESDDKQQSNMEIDNVEKTENSDKTPDEQNGSEEYETPKNKRSKDEDSDTDEDPIKEKNDKGRWKRSKLLTVNFSSTDTEEEKRKIEKKITIKNETLKNTEASDNTDQDCEIITDSSPTKKKRTRRRRLASDSDIKITDDSDDSVTDSADKKNKANKSDNDKKDEGKKGRKRRKRSDNSSDSCTSLEVKKSKPKRKRIRAVADDSDSESANDLNSSQGRLGRKNIRKLLKDKQVADDTKQAAKLEEERLRRMAERQKLYNEMYEARLANEEKVDKLVLDFDEESKEVLLSVDENLVKRLKPHQARGIKFMWDAAYESLERAKTTSGSGCILAHCMGLGKSFQVVTLSHTLLSNSEKTGVKTILIVAPLSTVLNWVNEFKIWLSEVENGADIEIYEMTKCKTTYERQYQLESWMRTGGILMIGYEMFRNLTNATKRVKKNVRESILRCLIDPGADLVVCDEGHLLKNEDSAISKAMRRIRTLRRVVLTGTPLQNNLIEYHCMVQFVKPNLLGTKKEFSNRFVNPIQNGQFDDSTEYDVKVMKKRAHVLHKMLEGSVQRYDYSVLMPFLPPKQEYVILARLTEVQVKLYQYYLDKLARQQVRVGSTLFADFQALQRVWTHPSVVKSHTEKMIEKRRDADTDSEGSLRDFIDDGSDSDNSVCVSSNNNSDVVNLDSSGDEIKPTSRGTRANPSNEPEPEPEPENKGEWWSEFVQPEHFDDMRVSAKLLLLFDIIKESEAIGDKVLVFSQSLYSLTLIEKFLGMIDDETQKGNDLETLDHHTGSWSLGLDYFRFDGQTSADNRSHWVRLFNKPSNTRARLFLISTRAGGLGINLTAANRVVIFDASWNPSHDVQSIFRIYRFGQKKPCYVYRLLAAGTMEEKIYNRQVTKLSLACRVVDEQQIERHFSNNDLAELYKFEPPKSEPSQLALPKDRLLAEIFLRHKNLVETYHEHDSLLENIAEEELDDEERKQAWLEYEQEKAGKRMMPMQMYPNYQQHQMLMLQQFNNQMMNGEMNVQAEFQNLLQFASKDYPHLTEAAQREMALRTLSNMYSYVENQVTTHLNNPVNIPNNPTATLANALAQQEYARQHATVNKHRQQQQQQQQLQLQQQQQQMQYAQKFGNNIGNAVPPTVRTVGATSRDDDIVEIPPSGSRTNSTLPASSSTKSQEE